MHKPGERTYNFIDMTGQSGAGLLVIDQAESAGTGARWHVVYEACRHPAPTMPGTQLRAIFKDAKRRHVCRQCFPKVER